MEIDLKTGEYLEIKQYHVAKEISKYGPYRFFVTLTFQRLVDDASALKHAEVFIGRLHKKLFGRYKWRAAKPLSGVSLLELKDVRKKRRYVTASNGVEVLKPAEPSKTLLIRDRGNCHFHFLIRWHPELGRNQTDALKRLEVAVRSAGMSLNYSKTEKLVGKDGVKVERVLDKGVVNYVSKEARDLSWWDEDRLFFIRRSQDGRFELVPGRIPLRPWWNMPINDLRAL